jgi:hypothetical protein
MKLIPGKSSSVHRDILLQRATFHVRPSTSTRGDSCFTYTDSNLTTVASRRTQTIAQAEMDSKSGGTAPPQAAFTVPKASPEDLQPLIIPPPHPDSKQPHALVLLICGALLYPKDYQELTAALKQLSATTSTVSLWIAVATVDWAGLGPPQTALTSAPAAFDAAAQGALEAAIAQGFQPSDSGVGRMENLFVALHSAAVLAAKGVAVQKAAGTILLGGNLLKTEDFMASAATYPRPLLHIYGQLDGQLSPCKAALTATEIATFGPMLGPKGVARIRPLVIIPGMNHAQVSNGVVNAPRGDLEASISHTKAAQEIAAAVLHFIVLYAPGNVAQSARDTSLDALTEATWHAVEFLAPFAEKLGRPNPAALLRSGSAEAEQKHDGFPPLALGFGAEGLPVTASNIGAFAHPGELAAAKRFAESAQRRLLESSLPVEDLSKVKVFAVAHTTAQTFMYSQSTILQTAPHAWSVQVHVLLERAAYKSGNLDPTSFVSPVYALKLKAAEQVAVVSASLATFLTRCFKLIGVHVCTLCWLFFFMLWCNDIKICRASACAGCWR